MTAPGKHTPGPWGSWPHYGGIENAYVVGPGNFETVCEVRHGCEEVAGDTAANARLIAAAPDLLEDGWSLAVAALQSQRYAKESDFRRAVDAMLDTCRRARGEPTLAEREAATKATGDAK